MSVILKILIYIIDNIFSVSTNNSIKVKIAVINEKSKNIYLYIVPNKIPIEKANINWLILPCTNPKNVADIIIENTVPNFFE